MVIITLAIIFLYRLRQNKKLAKNKLHQNEAAPLTNTHVQLLGYHKGDNSEILKDDNLDKELKSVNEKLLVALEKSSLKIKDINVTPRVSYYDGCDEDV